MKPRIPAHLMRARTWPKQQAATPAEARQALAVDRGTNSTIGERSDP